MFYNVYRVSSSGLPRDHHALFVETNNNDQSGWIFQVTGNIQQGMTYEDKSEQKPGDSATYQDRVCLGKVAVANFDGIKPICESIPAPRKQFDRPRRLYPREPIRRCQEWTAEVVDALRAAGVLEGESQSQNQSQSQSQSPGLSSE